MSGVVRPDGKVIFPMEEMAVYRLQPFQSPRDTAVSAISCRCGRQIFDGRMIKARVVDVVAGQAKCRTCKSWVKVPVAVLGGWGL